MNERIGYKVVTTNMESLGLRNNHNILVYPQGEWFRLPSDWIVEGSGDWGGIWFAKTKSKAKGIQKEMRKGNTKRPPTETRIFVVLYDRILYENSYRIKTNAIFLRQEIT